MEGLEEVPLSLFTASADVVLIERVLLLDWEVLWFELLPPWLFSWCFFLALRKRDFSLHEYLYQT